MQTDFAARHNQITTLVGNLELDVHSGLYLLDSDSQLSYFTVIQFNIKKWIKNGNYAV